MYGSNGANGASGANGADGSIGANGLNGSNQGFQDDDNLYGSPNGKLGFGDDD